MTETTKIEEHKNSMEINLTNSKKMTIIIIITKDHNNIIIIMRIAHLNSLKIKKSWNF